MSNKLILDKDKILAYQKNRDPYLMIDYASEVIPGKSSKGYKDLKESEWFFKVHWPEDPNMPGMLQIEALVQMASLGIFTLPGLKGKLAYLTSANFLKFYKKIKPNSRLEIETSIKSFKRGVALCSGKGFVKEELACAAEFNLVIVEELNKYKINEQ